MIVTDNDRLAERIRLLRSHGMTTLTWDRHRGHAHSYDVVEQGFNYRLDELRAAIGLVELRRLRERNAARARIVRRYRSELQRVEGLRMPFEDDETAAHHLAVVVLPEDCSRDAFRAGLTASGIQTSVHYPPIHRFSYYRGLGTRRPLPVTEEVADRLVTLPLYPHMRDVDVSAVTSAALEAISGRREERSTETGRQILGGKSWN
jgi:dTDP-4-amino-4,6-dideoxygalactose transaminase